MRHITLPRRDSAGAYEIMLVRATSDHIGLETRPENYAAVNHQFD